MSLPKINQPIYRLTIPSTGEEIRYRPFVVKEEKILLMAMESNDQRIIIDAITQIIQNCVVSGELKVDRLASFDIEYLFINLRARSVSEIVELSSPCEDCDIPIEFSINLNDIEVPVVNKADEAINISDGIGVMMKYPTLESMSIDMSAGGPTDAAFRVIATCVDKIYDENQIHDVKEYSKEEIVDWLENLPKGGFDKLQEFFVDMPSLSHSVNITCAKCKKDKEIVMEGMSSFLS